MFPPHRSHKENDRYFTCDCLASVEIGIHNNNNNTIGESQVRKVSKRQENKALNMDEEEVEVEDDILIYGSRSRKTVTTKKVHLEAP